MNQVFKWPYAYIVKTAARSVKKGLTVSRKLFKSQRRNANCQHCKDKSLGLRFMPIMSS